MTDAEPSNPDHIVCKFMECMQVELDLLSSYARSKHEQTPKFYNERKVRKPRTKKWYNQEEEVTTKKEIE